MVDSDTYFIEKRSHDPGNVVRCCDVGDSSRLLHSPSTPAWGPASSHIYHLPS